MEECGRECFGHSQSQTVEYRLMGPMESRSLWVRGELCNVPLQQYHFEIACYLKHLLQQIFAFFSLVLNWVPGKENPGFSNSLCQGKIMFYFN